MTQILTDLSRPALVRAIQQNLYDVGWELRKDWKQAVFYNDKKIRRWWSPIPIAFIFNAAFSLQPPDGDETELIHDTIAFFQSRARDGFDWWLFPGLETRDWARQLEAHGLTLESDPPGMALDLSTLPQAIPLPAGIAIKIVTDAEMMKTWNATFVQGYGLPPDWEAVCQEMMLAALIPSMTSYLAFVEDQPVAVSTLFLDAGVAGIYNVATLPAWRGKGIGGAMSLFPLLDARKRGFRAGILQSSEMGYQVYQRMGFKELCRLDHYHWQAKA